MEPEDQDQKNQSESFLKESERKATDKLKDLTKKATKGIKHFIGKHPVAFAIIVGGIIAFFVLIVLFTGFLDIVEKGNFKAIVESLFKSTSEGEKGTKTITINKDKESYEISYDVTEDDIEIVKKELEKQGKDPSKFTEYELKFITALAKNEFDFSDLSVSELKALPIYLKAEMATQNLDLRKRDEMYNSSTNTFNKVDINNLQEEQIQGVIHVKRANTSGEETVLEYIDKETFDKYIVDGDTKVLEYFTLDDNENLVIATWNYTKTTYKFEGKDIPIEITEGKKDEETYILSSISIPYKAYISKYTMPFEFLTAMLIRLEDPEFCMEIANLAQGSNIVIEIQEQMKETNTVEQTKYKVTNREFDYIDYKVNPNQLETKANHLIEKTKIDNVACTAGNVNDTIKVTRTTNYKENKYTAEIIEADTWIASYKHNYESKKTETKSESQITPIQGEYQEFRNDVYTEANQIREEIYKNSNISEFQENKIKEYTEKNIANININIISEKDETGKIVNKYLKINSNKVFQTILGDNEDLEAGRNNKYNCILVSK